MVLCYHFSDYHFFCPTGIEPCCPPTALREHAPYPYPQVRERRPQPRRFLQMGVSILTNLRKVHLNKNVNQLREYRTILYCCIISTYILFLNVPFMVVLILICNILVF